MSKNAFVKRGSFRSSALLSVAALATTGLVATAVPAGAALTQGAEDATTGAPAYFVDSEGVALQLCLDACAEVPEAEEPEAPEEGEEGEEPGAEEPAEPVAANHAPYFMAAATVGGFNVEWELATIPGEDEAGNETAEVGGVENAVRINARDLALNAQYRVRGPWGSFTVRSDNRGRVDFRRASGGEAGSPLNGPVQSFLRGVNASGDMIGDPELATRVTGSPTGFNRVTVSGPGVNASKARFALTGQLLEDTAMSSMSKDALKLGNITTSTASTKGVRLDSFGTAPLNVSWTKGGLNPGAFTVRPVNLAGGDVRLDVTYTPRANRDVSAVLRVNDGGLAAPERVKLTGVAHDTRSPKLSERTPTKGATVRAGKNVKVTFSEAVRGVKGSTFMLVDRAGDKVRASVDRVRRSNKYVLNPGARLDRDSRYTVKLNGGRKAIRDRAGNVAKDMSWGFRTR